MGVSAPPQFETMKMKKTMWNALIRILFIRIHGRISTMEAPVVPITFAISAPMARKTTLSSGVASPFTLRWMPPATTKREPMSTMNEKYSCSVRPTDRAALGQADQEIGGHQQAQPDRHQRVIALPEMLRPLRRQRHHRDQREQQAERNDERRGNVRIQSGGERQERGHGRSDASRMPIRVNVPELSDASPALTRTPCFDTARASALRCERQSRSARAPAQRGPTPHRRSRMNIQHFPAAAAPARLARSAFLVAIALQSALAGRRAAGRHPGRQRPARLAARRLPVEPLGAFPVRRGLRAGAPRAPGRRRFAPAIPGQALRPRGARGLSQAVFPPAPRRQRPHPVRQSAAEHGPDRRRPRRDEPAEPGRA